MTDLVKNINDLIDVLTIYTCLVDAKLLEQVMEKSP